MLSISLAVGMIMFCVGLKSAKNMANIILPWWKKIYFEFFFNTQVLDAYKISLLSVLVRKSVARCVGDHLVENPKWKQKHLSHCIWHPQLHALVCVYLPCPFFAWQIRSWLLIGSSVQDVPLLSSPVFPFPNWMTRTTTGLGQDVLLSYLSLPLRVTEGQKPPTERTAYFWALL